MSRFSVPGPAGVTPEAGIMRGKTAISFRLPAAAAFAFLIGLGAPLPSTGDGGQSGSDAFVSSARAQSGIRNLISRLRREKLPASIAKTNGRIEATQVDVSSKYAGRLAEVMVEEGSSVTQGQVIARVFSPEYEAQLRAAQADVQRAKDALIAAEAEIVARQSALEFAKSDYQRGQELMKTGTITKQAFEQRKRNFDAADAAVKSFTSQRDQAKSSIKNSEAEVERIESIIQDLTLTSPRSGRVQYQLARAGEVVAAGAPIVTILDLTDVYMTIFLPAAVASRLEIGGEARIVLDAVPDYVIPAAVSFVAADAQFTPKTVETKDERAKLMFRVKLKLDPQVLRKFYTKVKTGLRGMGFVRTDPSTPWPHDLQIKLPADKAPKPGRAKTAAPEAEAPGSKSRDAE
ncbi:HlyD family secretion protein [Methylocapsa aurea]|uniref:HlyD family secretion protein n=1 Tax=Methylocapsa aurea TaxID=663610 RepID=UPI000A5CC70F|nr:HlyD family efflux transporter periplasmic adaptor subunit [Methylocapsa aurea]